MSVSPTRAFRTRALAEFSSRELRSLLEEESALWSRELLWDYADVSAAVASGLDRRTLTGQVLEEGRRPVAYCYYMTDSGRAIVGSLFATEGLRGQGIEEDLLEGVLAEAQGSPGQDRVECQTLFSTARRADERFARFGFAGRPRHYLMRSLSEPLEVPSPRVTLVPLRRDDLGVAARIIHESHQGSLDAALNMTYATPSLCRNFVETLVLRAGCGRFDPDASVLAVGPGGPVGCLLASHLSSTNGHICQVSVAPEAQHGGLGKGLLSACLLAMRREGLTTASLSVTVGNEPAYGLYQRLGFRVRKVFAAHAWLRPPGRIELPA